jgi:hypothetical protein
MDMPKLPPLRPMKARSTKPRFNNGFKPGIYETFYGNAVMVLSSSSRTGYDLDAACRVPIADVEPGSFKRALTPEDHDNAYSGRY